MTNYQKEMLLWKSTIRAGEGFIGIKFSFGLLTIFSNRAEK